jgi:hypothetical protein
MEIKILGPGCPKCKTLEQLTRDVVSKNKIDATITKVEDIVIDGKVVVKGRIPSAEEIKQLLTK